MYNVYIYIFQGKARAEELHRNAQVRMYLEELVKGSFIVTCTVLIYVNSSSSLLSMSTKTNKENKNF